MAQSASEKKLAALSISRTVGEWLNQERFAAQALAVFEHACNLITGDGDVIALVIPQVGDGPLNVVVDGETGIFSGVAPGAPVTLGRDCFQVGGLRVDLREAATWEPRPDWETLRVRREAVKLDAPLLRALCDQHAPFRSLLALLETRPSADVLTEAVFSQAREAAEALRKGWGGDLAQLRVGAKGLAGLGEGLTPAGDDFLSGVMLWAWLAHPAPASFCRSIVQAAGQRTTTLSAAFLRAAARGECSAPWHKLLAALGQNAKIEIEAAILDVLTHGATSGADTLAGFLTALTWEAVGVCARTQCTRVQFGTF
jgi:hypothetical protein